jgi:hypothetical protein
MPTKWLLDDQVNQMWVCPSCNSATLEEGQCTYACISDPSRLVVPALFDGEDDAGESDA